MTGKKKLNLKRLLIHALYTAAAAVVLLMPVSCDLFETGLGSKVDITAPSISIVSPNPRSVLYTNANFTLSGHASDDIGVEKVIVKVPTASGTRDVFASLNSDGSWSATINQSVMEEGENRIEAIAYDGRDQHSSTFINVEIDRSAPTVLVTSPLSYEPQGIVTSDVFTLKGESWDGDRTASVSVDILNDADELVHTFEAEGTSSWTAMLEYDDFGEMFADGMYSFRIRALDRAGNESSSFFHFQDLSNALSEGVSASTATVDLLGKIQLGKKTVSEFPGEWDALIENLHEEMDFERNTAAPVVQIQVPADGGLIGGDAASASGTATVTGSPLHKILFATVPFSGEEGPSSPSDEEDWIDGLPEGSTGEVPWIAAISLKDQPEGKYRLFVRAKDMAENYSEEVYRDFNYDNAAPVLTETGIGITPKYLNNDFTFSGSVSDTNGLASLVITRDGITVYEKTDFVEGSNSWSYAIVLPEDLDDSQHNWAYQVAATDIAGRVSSLERRVLVDVADPVIVFADALPSLEPDPDMVDGVDPGYGLRRVNGTITVRGNANDGSEISALYLTVGSDPEEEQASNYSFEKSINTNEYDNLSVLNITVRALDISGNEATETQSLWVDQSTDTPVISFSNLDASIQSETGIVANLLETNPLLIGTVADDDKIDVSTLEINIDGSGWEAVSERPSADTAQGSFRHSFDSLSTGVHRLQVRVQDIGGKLETYPADPMSMYFAIDTDLPLVSFDDAAGVIYVKADSIVELSGKASDNSGLKTNADGNEHVEIRVAPGLWQEIEINAEGSWSWALDTTSFGSGERTVEVRAYDVYGKTNSASRSITVDNEAPGIFISSVNPILDAAYEDAILVGGTVNGVVTVRGSAGDNYLLKELAYKLGGDPASESGAGYTTMPLNPNWTIELDTETVSDGVHNLYIRAVDAAGNAGVKSIELTVDQSTDRPVVSFENLDFTASDATQAGKNLLGSGGTITGTVSDDDGLPDTLTLFMDVNGDGIFEARTINMSGSSTIKQFSIDPASLGLVQGAYAFYIEVSDSGTNKKGKPPVSNEPMDALWFAYDTAPPVLNINTASGQWKNAAFAVEGTASDSYGLARVEVSTDSAATYNSILEVAGMTDSSVKDWSYNIPATYFTEAAPDASHTFYFRATDSFGRTRVLEYVFNVDTTEPTITAVTPFPDYVENELAVSGSAADTGAHASGLVLLEYRIEAIDTDWQNLTGTSDWFRTIALNSIAQEGIYTVQFRATDRAGNVSTPISRDFIIDRANPVLTVEAAYDSVEYKQGNFSIGGTVYDSRLLGASPVSVSLNGPSGAGLGALVYSYDSGTETGTWSQPVTAGNDGEYIITITATDDIGRTSSTQRTVIVDSTAPTLDVTNLADGALIEQGSYTIRGTASDNTGGSGTARVQYKYSLLNEDTNEDTTWTSLTDANGTDNWTIVLDPLAETLTGEIQIEAVDNSGNSSSETLGFSVDTADPAIENLEIDSDPFGSGLQYKNAEFDISFDITDSLQLASYSFTRTNPDESETIIEENTSLSGTALPLIFTQTPGTEAGELADGTYEYTITVTDAVGKSTSLTRTVMVDTEAPALLVTAPAPDESVDTDSYTIRGTADDGDGKGVASIEYSLNSSNGIDGDWTAIDRAFSWSAAGLNFSSGGEGPKTLWVRASDGLNTNTEMVAFYYDTAAPAFTEATVGLESAQYLNAEDELTFGGTVWDTNTSGSVTVSVSINGAAATTDGVTITGDTWTDTTTWTYTVDADTWVEGSYTLTFTATDAAERTVSVTRNIVVDKTAPSLADVSTYSGWQTSASLPLSGSVSDALSGVDKVEYRTSPSGPSGFGTTWTVLALKNNAGTLEFSGTISYAEGDENLLQVRAVDLAGNVSSAIERSVWIDTQAPTFLLTSPLDIPLLNGSVALPVDIEADDGDGSGLFHAAISTSRTSWTAGDIIAETSTFDINGAASLSIPAATLADFDDGPRQLYVRVSDSVGFNSPATTLSLLMDQEVTEVQITSHDELDIVNKTIALSGTASDENGLTVDSAVLQIWNNTGSSWEAASYDEVVSGSSSWTVSNLDTTDYEQAAYDASPDAGFQLRLRVGVQDKAGNMGYAERTLTVDQHTDRPIVRLNNINTDGSTTLKSVTTIYGSVMDDDGDITALYIAEPADPVNNPDVIPGDWGTPVVMSGASFTYESSADDGPKIIYFRVIDAKGNSFISSTTEILERPRIEVRPATEPVSYVDGNIVYAVDTKPPEITSSVEVDRSGDGTFEAANIEELSTNMGFGGDKASFRLRLKATDENEIDYVRVNLSNEPLVYYTATFNAVSEYYETENIDVSGVTDDQYVTLTVEVSDTSELKTSLSRTVLLDNSMPEVSHQSPRQDIPVNGDILVRGGADDGVNGSGLKSVHYKIGRLASTDPDLSSGWQPVSDGLVSWEISFENTNTINQYGTSDYGTETAPGSNYWVVPILMRVEDKLGNVLVTDHTEYTLIVDPDGDRPLVYVTYPDPDEDNRVMGGIIRIFGGAEDEDGVDNVRMQIDVNNDGVMDDLDVVTLKEGTVDEEVINWYNGGDGQLVNGGISWNMAINTDGEFNPEETPLVVDEIQAGIRYRIEEPGTTDFTQLGAVNSISGSEFTASRDGTAGDGTGTVRVLLRRIQFRVRSEDVKGLESDWTEWYSIDVDNEVPKIGSHEELRLVHADGTVLPYRADMYVRGDWTLMGSIEDESGIDDIIISGSVSGSLGANPSWFTSYEEPQTGYYNYLMEIPVNSVAGSSGALSIEIRALDASTPQMESVTTLSINYDNLSPDVDSYSYDGATPIQQSNSTYMLSSSLEEVGSGFERVAFYFLRKDPDNSANDRVYNPMESDESNANRTWVSDLVMLDELPRLYLDSVDRLASTRSLQHASIVGNLNVRKGGLVKIGGLDRLITAVDHTTGVIEWADPVSTDITEAWIAYALVVDNMSPERPNWNGDVLESITGDDGDFMVESVERSGTLYSWTASIDSRNLPDGPIEIHYVAFDKAGNHSAKFVSTNVRNNPPLIAGVYLGTDLNGNNSISAEEKIFYSALGGDDQPQATVALDSASFIAKDDSSIEVDIVGGNGDLFYTLAVDGGPAGSLTAFSVIELGRTYLESLGDALHSFVVKIWDSTELMEPGVDSLSAQLSVPMTVDVVDGIEPVVAIDPFYWNSASDNSLYDNSTENGHIELEDDLPTETFIAADGLYDLDPKVSGKVSIRGSAYDDTRLYELWAFIGDGTTSVFTFTGAPITSNQFDTDGDGTPETLTRTYTRLAYFNTGTGAWVKEAETTVDDDDWAITLIPDYLDQSGHHVNWRLDWDSAKITGVADTDITVRVIVTDSRLNASNETETETGDVETNNVPAYQMDVVPYIQKIGTVLSNIKKNNPSVYNRTALGRYPVSEDETITLSGFNLGGDQTISMAGHTSGDFTFTVNTITTLNNDNNNSVEYNQLPNGDNNPDLTDDVILDVWEINSTAVHSVGGGIKEPIMKINPNNGMAGFAFANGVDSFSMANGTTNSYTHWQQNYADYGEVAFGFDAQGRSHGIVIGHDTEPNSGYTGRMNYTTSIWGVPLDDARDNFRFYRKLRMESCGLPVGADLNGVELTSRMIDTTRFQSPSLAVASSTDRTNPTLYLAYYDNLQEQIRFRWGTNNDATRNVADTGFNQFYDVDTAAGRNSTSEWEYSEHVIFEPDASRYSLIAGDENDGTGDTGNTAGEYVAIDVITGANANADIVTIVWYDGANLMYTYRYGTKDDTNASSDGVAGLWSEPITIFTDAGLDCAISVDDTADHGVHIAAYDRNEGSLRYAYLHSYNAAESEVQTCVVDDYNIVGNKISITTVLEDYDDDDDPVTPDITVVVPYISYYMPSAQKPKLAFLADPSGDKAPNGVNEDTEFTGDWEVTMIPTGSSVREDRVNVDLWRDEDNKAKNSSTGESSSDATSGIVYGNGTSNPLAAYVVTEGTRGYIETAQKK